MPADQICFHLSQCQVKNVPADLQHRLLQRKLLGGKALKEVIQTLIIYFLMLDACFIKESIVHCLPADSATHNLSSF